MDKSKIKYLIVGNTYYPRQFWSSSLRKKVALVYVDMASFEASSNLQPVLFPIKSRTGKSIADLSTVSIEDEVIFGPDTRFRIVESYYTDHLLNIHLEEI